MSKNCCRCVLVLVRLCLLVVFFVCSPPFLIYSHGETKMLPHARFKTRLLLEHLHFSQTRCLRVLPRQLVASATLTLLVDLYEWAERKRRMCTYRSMVTLIPTSLRSDLMQRRKKLRFMPRRPVVWNGLMSATMSGNRWHWYIPQ